MSRSRCASCSSGTSPICRKCRTMPRTSSTRVAVDGSCPSRCAKSGSASHSSARISAYSAAFDGKCLNSRPSEIEAAAATLLVVVPAKPWRAKQRLAAPKINCRRKSPVMRSVLMLVSKHSPYQMSRILLRCTRPNRLNRPKPERTADARHRKLTVAAGEHPLQVSAVDLDAGKARPARDVLHTGRKRLDIGHGRDGAGIRDSASPGDPDEVDGRRGVARLPAGFAVDLVVEHDDGEIFGRLQANGCET